MESSDISAEDESSSYVSHGDQEDNHMHDLAKLRTHLRPKYRKSKTVPEFVSKWKRKHIEKLNIFYDTNYLQSPLDVLFKKGRIDNFSEMQRQYIDKMKSYLHFDAVYVKNETIHHKVGYGAFYSAFLKPLLDDIRKSIKPPKKGDRESKTGASGGSTSTDEAKDCTCSNYINVMAKVYVDDFIKELSVLLKITDDYIKDSRTDLVKEMYSELFRSFVTMCHLKPSVGKAAPCYWHGLMGVDVSSKPDFRLCKKAMSSEEDDDVDPHTVVTVVEMKKDPQHKEHEEPLKKKRKVTSHNYSTESSSSDDSESDILEMNKSSSDDDNSNSPEIESDLSEEMLGQHAGELLLDMRKYSTNSNKMPGVIVKGTKVFFTLLEMTAVHLHKLLYTPLELDKDNDIATIFYSKPLDILVEEDRNTLIDNFMRLNNFHTGE